MESEEKKATKKASWKILFVNMLGSAINFDSKLIATFSGLLLHPGKTMRDAVDEGDPEERYSNPMQFVFFFGVICLLALLIFPDSDLLLYIPADPKNIWQRLFSQFANNYILYTCVSILLFNFLPFYISFGLSKAGRTRNMPQLYMYLLYQQGLFFFFEAVMSPVNIVVNFTIWWDLFFFVVFFAQLFFTIRMDMQFFRIKFINAILRYLLQFILTPVFVLLFMSPILFGALSSTENKEYKNMMGFVVRKQMGDLDVIRRMFTDETDDTYYDSWLYQSPVSNVVARIVKDLQDKDSTYGINYRYDMEGNNVIYTCFIDKDSSTNQSTIFDFIQECNEKQMSDSEVEDIIKELRYRELFQNNPEDIPQSTHIYHRIIKDSLLYEERYVEKNGIKSLSVRYTIDEVELMAYFSSLTWHYSMEIDTEIDPSKLTPNYWYIGNWISDDSLCLIQMDVNDGDDDVPHYIMLTSDSKSYGWIEYDGASGYCLHSRFGDVYPLLVRGNLEFYLRADDSSYIHFIRLCPTKSD